jgi:hypothetical protein
VARELARYMLDFMGVQEIRWNKGGIEQAEDYTLFMEKEMKIIN